MSDIKLDLRNLPFDLFIEIRKYLLTAYPSQNVNIKCNTDEMVQLPDEIISKILRSRKVLYAASRIISKNIRILSIPSILENEYAKDITLGEIIDYVTETGKPCFIFDESSSCTLRVKKFQYNGDLFSPTTHEYEISNKGQLLAERTNRLEVKRKARVMYSVDIITTYHIKLRRLRFLGANDQKYQKDLLNDLVKNFEQSYIMDDDLFSSRVMGMSMISSIIENKKVFEWIDSNNSVESTKNLYAKSKDIIQNYINSLDV